MKLSPPASSSDLEAARDIARRLHQHRRRQDRSGPEEPPVHVAARRPRPESPAPLAPPPRPAPVTPPLELETTPEPPSWDEPVTDTGEPPPEVEEPGISPEEMVGSGEAPPFEALPESPYEALSSPFEVELDETDAPADRDFGAPAPPSWDDIVEVCLGLAQATGAMLVDPSGQVFAARGEWPEPGPEAIAAKLVSTMERTLRDAPTRSISAPLMGKHLTAWRIALAEGLITTAFIGDAPVRAEARPAIDTEIHRGAGA